MKGLDPQSPRWDNGCAVKYKSPCCHSVTKSSPTLRDPMDCSTPGFPILHYFPEFGQTHVHCVNDVIQPSHPLFSSVAQSCPTLCDPMDWSTLGLPVHHQLLELTQTHVHWVHDAIQPSHPLFPPYPPAFNLSQHQDLFQWVNSSRQMAKVSELQLQHQSFQWIFRVDIL